MNEAELMDKVIAQLRTVFDPELPVNLYDLGLIYKCDLKPADGLDKHNLDIDMTLTTPNCPVAGMMPQRVRDAVVKLPELNEVTVQLVFDPPWTKDRMTDEVKLQLNMF